VAVVISRRKHEEVVGDLHAELSRLRHAMLVDSMQGWDQYDETLANLNLALEANIAQEARINAVLDMLDRLPAKATTVSVRKVREALS
jgi:hypothetical protein